jgi:hypothetical protein
MKARRQRGDREKCRTELILKPWPAL